MSSAAVMLCKDELDVIEPVLRHLAANVDEILVADNLSTDGTFELLERLAGELPLVLTRDEDQAYYQSVKTSALALEALNRGHSWIVPCDADEVWYVPDGRRLADWFGGLAPDVQFVTAAIRNHMPTALDPPAACPRCGDSGVEPPMFEFEGEPSKPVRCTLCRGLVAPNPLRRIGYRQREAGALPKVACRARPDLVIHQGNHSASTSGTGMRAAGLEIRHFTWRSPEQFVRKVRNGAAAYAASDLDEDFGKHWRGYGQTLDESGEDALVSHFRHWFWSANPDADDTLMFDPAPIMGQGQVD